MAGRVGGKVALVTGGASGIGRRACEKLAAEGATVVLTDIQNRLGGEVAASLQKAGGKAEYIHHDVTEEAAWEDVIGQPFLHPFKTIEVDEHQLGLNRHVVECCRERGIVI